MPQLPPEIVQFLSMKTRALWCVFLLVSAPLSARDKAGHLPPEAVEKIERASRTPTIQAPPSGQDICKNYRPGKNLSVDQYRKLMTAFENASSKGENVTPPFQQLNEVMML